MTDRLKGCTVVFKQPLRADDAALLLETIRQLRGVSRVCPEVMTSGDYVVRAAVKQEVWEKIVRVFTDDK